MGLGGRKDVPGPLFLSFIILIFIFQLHLTPGHSCLVDDKKGVVQSVGIHSVVEGCVLFERCVSRARAFGAGFVRACFSQHSVSCACFSQHSVSRHVLSTGPTINPDRLTYRHSNSVR